MAKFVKGQSGNPGGRPSDHALRDAARGQTEQAIKTLVTIMNNPKSPAASRITAASALLDRGYGKPTQSLDVSGEAPMLNSLQVMFVNSATVQREALGYRSLF